MGFADEVQLNSCLPKPSRITAFQWCNHLMLKFCDQQYDVQIPSKSNTILARTETPAAMISVQQSYFPAKGNPY